MRPSLVFFFVGWLPLACTGSNRAPSTPPAPAPPPPLVDPADAAPGPPPDAGVNPAAPADLAWTFGHRPALSSQQGEASYYSDALAGRSTASGEPYDPNGFTAAHRSLPFGTVVRVTAPTQRRTVYVRINDRGPFGKRRRIIDLSKAAATHLGMLRIGVCPVIVEVVGSANGLRQ